MAKRKHELTESESDRTSSESSISKSVHYGDVTIFYFQRVQSFSCVPSLGGIALGLASSHCYSEQKPLCNVDDDDLAKSCDTGALTSKKRKKILRLAGVRSWQKAELKHAKEIRLSRLKCGCSCGDFCFPQTCSCCLNGVGCQVDEGTFPCSCRPNCCLNSEGRQAFNAMAIARHQMETLNRVRMNTESWYSSIVYLITTGCWHIYSQEERPKPKPRTRSSICFQCIYSLFISDDLFSISWVV